MDIWLVDVYLKYDTKLCRQNSAYLCTRNICLLLHFWIDSQEGGSGRAPSPIWLRFWTIFWGRWAFTTLVQQSGLILAWCSTRLEALMLSNNVVQRIRELKKVCGSSYNAEKNRLSAMKAVRRARRYYYLLQLVTQSNWHILFSLKAVLCK